MLAGREGVEAHELRVADEPVGVLRVRAGSPPDPVVLRLVTTIVASEVERLRAPSAHRRRRPRRSCARCSRAS